MEAPTETSDVPEPFRKVPVSVGIAFVDSHFPFRRAHHIAEGVRGEAKKKSADLKGVSVMNWWINRPGSLEMDARPTSRKPYPLRSSRPDFGWDILEQHALKKLWMYYAKSRNKFKDLMAKADDPDPKRAAAAARALLKGRPVEYEDPDDRRMRRVDRLDLLPEGWELEFNPDTGFDPEGQRTPLVDAGELFDLHFPFERPMDATDEAPGNTAEPLEETGTTR
jgi:hypothetical protein